MLMIKSVDLEYKQNPEISPDEVQKLIEWIKQQPHLPEINENEAILFLHSCLFSMEFAKQTVDIHFTMKTHCPEYFSGWDFQNEDLRKAMKTVAIFPIKDPTPEGYRVFWGKLSDYDASNFSFINAIKVYCIIFQLWLLQCGTAPGHIFIMDLIGLSLGHITRIGPFLMKKFLYYLQEAAPIRIKAFHFINIVPHTDKLLGLMKPFMKKDLYDSLHIHPTMEAFSAFVPMELIPKDYGGKNCETTQTLADNFYQVAIDNQDYFTKDEQRRVDENLRPGKPQNASSLFGVEGNFKKLDID